VGKQLRVQSIGLDALIDVLDPNGSSTVGGPGSTTLTTDPLPSAGTYFVVVTAQSDFDAAHNTYDLAIRLQ
jgi:hypothetical protein